MTDQGGIYRDGKFKVKLSTGRIVGPIDLTRVQGLIQKKHITGVEQARRHPDGDWQDINEISEIAELLVAFAAGLGPVQAEKMDMGTTRILEPIPQKEKSLSAPALKTLSQVPVSSESHEDKTQITSSLEEATQVGVSMEQSPVAQEGEVELQEEAYAYRPRKLSEERTVQFEGGTAARQNSSGSGQEGRRKPGRRETLTGLASIVAVGLMAYQLLLDEPKKNAFTKFVPIRPSLPAYSQEKADPQLSMKTYGEAMKYYVADTVTGYKSAADRLRMASTQDPGNVKALAMLASSYLNLIDSSNKDENYFSVISKLIEMSRAKALDVPETVIADVEFYLTVNKAEAAQNRIVEYTKVHQNFGLEMFYYLALAFYHRGDFTSAARYLAQFPDNKVYSAKIFYLRGQVAEKLKEIDAALGEYKKALKFNPSHAHSHLRIAALLEKRGALREAAPHLDFVVTHAALLPPHDLALGYYLHAQLSQLFQKVDVALFDIERAVKLDKDNHDYLLELYTLRAKAGATIQSVQKEARMYYFLGEGERLLRDGKYQDALTQFLQARQSYDQSELPPIKIGDMFWNLHDMQNARLNYKLAADRAPNNIEVWSKYIDVLIQSFDWEEAQKAMDRFRKLPVNQSAIDKAAADMYAKQGQHVEAQLFYKKAMARDVIDSGVYIAYAKSLMATRNYKDAPFFFALALRFDPLSADALTGIAKCIAETESIERAVTMLQDEMQKGTGARAELLAAIAELQIQRGDWEQAQRNVDQAIAASQEYAYPWKLQAQIYMNKDGVEKGAIDKALLAYKAYSDRNASDPSGYMERYKIFARKLEFEKASDELSNIYAIYPKYPNLHFFKGALYSLMGNHKAAIQEFKLEQTNNPNSVNTLLALGKEMIEVGAPQDALALFNKAMQLAPRSPEPKHQSAYANYLLKNYAGAVALYQAALALDKGNPMLYKRLGLAYQETGDVTGAAQAFRKYLEMEPDAPDRAQFERYR